MHKIRFCVITYSSSLQRESGIANFGGRYPWNANVDSFGFHMLTVKRHSMAVLAKIVITPRSAIPANNVNLTVRTAQSGQQVMQQVELPDVIVLHIIRAVVAEEMIKCSYTVRKILITYSVEDIQVFASMKVIKAKPIKGRISRRSCFRPCIGHGGERQSNYSTYKQRLFEQSISLSQITFIIGRNVNQRTGSPLRNNRPD